MSGRFAKPDRTWFGAGQGHGSDHDRASLRRRGDEGCLPGSSRRCGRPGADRCQCCLAAGGLVYNAVLLGYVYAATGSAAWVGAATIGRLVPYVLLGPLGGVVADRYDRRTVLLVGDVVRMGCMGLLAAAVAADAPVVLVIGITALASAAGTAERPAAMALLPRLVGEGRLGAANALLHTVQDLGVVLGPALGAVLLVLGPAEGAFVANAVTFAVSASLLATIRHRSKPIAERAGDGTLDQLRYGLRTARATPFVLPLFIVVAMAELTYGAQTVQLVLYSERRLDLGPEGYGYLLAAAGVGGLLSATVNHRLATSTRVSRIVVGAGALFCATQLAYAGVDSVPAALLVTVLGGVGIVACEVVAETALARVVPHDVLGRVMGVYDAISVAAMVAGAVLAPVIVGATSLRVSLLVLGLASLAVTALCLGALRGVDALSRRRAEALASHVSLLESLPIAAGLPRSVIETPGVSGAGVPVAGGGRRRGRRGARPRLLRGGGRRGGGAPGRRGAGAAGTRRPLR